MHDCRKRVAHFTVQKHIEFYKVGLFVADYFIIQTCVAARARFQRVEKVVNNLVQRDFVNEFTAAAVKVCKFLINAAFFLTKFHNRADVFGRSIDFGFHDGFFHILDSVGRGKVRRIADGQFFPVREFHLVVYARSGCDKVKIEFPFKAFLNDFHVQKPQKPATIPESERCRNFGLEHQTRVV